MVETVSPTRAMASELDQEYHDGHNSIARFLGAPSKGDHTPRGCTSRIQQNQRTDPAVGGSVNPFETYVKTKDLDLWHIILNGDFPPVARNKDTHVLEVVPFEQQDDDLKRKLAKNNEAKMVLYNALPKKDLKALDEGFSSKNYVRKFLRALHHKWREKVTSIKESKDLSSLALDELIGNLKVHEVVTEKDSEIYKGEKERVKSIALKAKKESSDDETSTSESDDEKYAMAVRNFKKFCKRNGTFVRQPIEEKKSFQQRDEKKGKSDRKCFRCGDPNHLIGDCTKSPRNIDQKAFIGGS
ncbi:zf-CCHC domain-containing protein [Tanacetum coccineum]